ncbi:DNA polymerase III subunit epsilon [Afifella sp. IM 167]|uniref:DNA polymerase III subunit epsilon n=1 Tax=Afifella sp. IM 167 TaxID=2033586 RepID=UPI001CCF3AE4|nr:DNA polymerase III subunit epsilon [Afifella sp. IM 167]MBZ8133533.1 DNA polymerase III subunit epsilon [Afifella sp. IM 167]
MREIVFDTETTGLDALRGDRLIEIGCVEIINRIPTGRAYHAYINPKRSISPDAVAVHGLTEAFLADKPCFNDCVAEFLEFVGDAPLVAHNASFDRGFINMELRLAGKPVIADDRFVDTLVLARRRHPGGQNSLDALCARYGIDNSARTKHGALLDAEILAEVYVELQGGRQALLALGSLGEESGGGLTIRKVGARPEPLAPRLSPEARAAHRAFVAAEMGADSLWAKFWPVETAAE